MSAIALKDGQSRIADGGGLKDNAESLSSNFIGDAMQAWASESAAKTVSGNSTEQGVLDFSANDPLAQGDGAAGQSQESDFDNFLVLGKSADGQEYQLEVNTQGEIEAIGYKDEDGNEHRLSDIKRDQDGNVIGFTDQEGKVWEKLPAEDSCSPGASAWTYKNEETGETPMCTVDLGNVTIDNHGIHADGREAPYELGVSQGN